MTKDQGETAFPAAGMQAIKTETIQSRVHAQLRELLMTGHFTPGQALKIHDLAQGFGTSVQPVRESIRQLVAERALEALPNRSARVPQLTRERIADLRRIRVALEGLAAELAAERATGDDIALLRRHLANSKQADDRNDIATSLVLNMHFHLALYALAGSPTLLPLIESLWLQIGPWMRQSADGFDAREGRGTLMHARMVAALERRDAAAARQAVEDDINRSFDLVIAAQDAAEAAGQEAAGQAAPAGAST